MSRTGFMVVLLIAMLWQSLALARTGSMSGAVADLPHFELHWQDEGHHHHEGGSSHIDDSTESVQHSVSDHVTASDGLLPGVSSPVHRAMSAPPRPVDEEPGPHPLLDGAFKPPRLSA
ncbi:MAG: hypothetical protein Q8L71_06010 [Thiobacillus sp.]|nr:hypothetical protein [Thiobacillus sp.]